jgi:hypothetical protein
MTASWLTSNHPRLPGTSMSSNPPQEVSLLSL